MDEFNFRSFIVGCLFMNLVIGCCYLCSIKPSREGYSSPSKPTEQIAKQEPPKNISNSEEQTIVVPPYISYQYRLKNDENYENCLENAKEYNEKDTGQWFACINDNELKHELSVKEAVQLMIDEGGYKYSEQVSTTTPAKLIKGL